MLQRAFSKLMRIPPLVWSVAVLGLSAVVVFTTFTVAVLSRNHTVGAAGIKKYGRICTACLRVSSNSTISVHRSIRSILNKINTLQHKTMHLNRPLTHQTSRIVRNVYGRSRIRYGGQPYSESRVTDYWNMVNV